MNILNYVAQLTHANHPVAWFIFSPMSATAVLPNGSTTMKSFMHTCNTGRSLFTQFLFAVSLRDLKFYTTFRIYAIMFCFMQFGKMICDNFQFNAMWLTWFMIAHLVLKVSRKQRHRHANSHAYGLITLVI
jgi:hypothetical protein